MAGCRKGRRAVSVTRWKAGSGLVVLVGVLVLGALALTATVTHDDLRVDEQLHAMRFALATGAARDLSHAAGEAVGLVVLAVGVVALFALRRRWAAARLFAMAGVSWVLALGMKKLFDRARPPARLWLLHPDHSGSFPSGTTTTAVVMLLVAGFVAWRARPLVRAGVIALGVAFALAVGVSRLYLGDHYPTDVAGSYLTVLAAVLVVSALSDLRWVRRLAAVVLRSPELTAAA